MMFCARFTVTETEPDRQDVTITIDHNGFVQSVRGPVSDKLGYHPLELVGRSVNAIIPPEVAEHHDEYLKRYIADPSKNRFVGVGPRSLQAVHRDGTLLPISISVSLGANKPLEEHGLGITLFVGRITFLNTGVERSPPGSGLPMQQKGSAPGLEGRPLLERKVSGSEREMPRRPRMSSVSSAEEKTLARSASLARKLEASAAQPKAAGKRENPNAKLKATVEQVITAKIKTMALHTEGGESDGSMEEPIHLPALEPAKDADSNSKLGRAEGEAEVDGSPGASVRAENASEGSADERNRNPPQLQARVAVMPAAGGIPKRRVRADQASMSSAGSLQRRLKKRRRALVALAKKPNATVNRLWRNLLFSAAVLLAITVSSFIAAESMSVNYASLLKHLSAASTRTVLSQLIAVEARTLATGIDALAGRGFEWFPSVVESGERLREYARDFAKDVKDLTFGMEGFQAPTDPDNLNLVFGKTALELDDLRNGEEVKYTDGFWAASQKYYQHALILASLSNITHEAPPGLFAGVPEHETFLDTAEGSAVAGMTSQGVEDLRSACAARIGECPSLFFVLHNGPAAIYEAARRASLFRRRSMSKAQETLLVVYCVSLAVSIAVLFFVGAFAFRPAFKARPRPRPAPPRPARPPRHAPSLPT
eukprot:tig00000441_g699.t1